MSLRKPTNCEFIALIAEYLGISQSTCSQYEIGVLNYPVEALMKLADFYNVSADYLLGRTSTKTPCPKK